MAVPSQAAKDAAFRNQNQALGVATASAPTIAFSALIPVAGPFIAAGVAAVGAAFGFRAIKLGKVVRDPPREDYSTPTTIAESTIDAAIVGGTPLEYAAADLIDAVDRSGRAFDAMMLALERSSGAELAGDAEVRKARIAEVYEFAQLASESLSVSADLAGPFRGAVDQLHVEILDRLDESGVPRRYLEPTDVAIADDPIAGFDLAIGSVAEGDYEFARYLNTAIADGSLIEPLAEELPA